mgnify:CR=1 FL=1
MTNFLKRLKPEYKSEYYEEALINSIDAYILQAKSNKKIFFLEIISLIKMKPLIMEGLLY